MDKPVKRDEITKDMWILYNWIYVQDYQHPEGFYLRGTERNIEDMPKAEVEWETFQRALNGR